MSDLATILFICAYAAFLTISLVILVINLNADHVNLPYVAVAAVLALLAIAVKPINFD